MNLCLTLSREVSLGTKTYGIQVDKKTGKAFGAPSPDMLAKDKNYTKEYSGVKDNTELFQYDQGGRLKKPVFTDPVTSQPVYEDDLRSDYRSIYQAYRDGIIVTQKDFIEALLDPKYDDDPMGSNFFF